MLQKSELDRFVETVKMISEIRRKIRFNADLREVDYYCNCQISISYILKLDVGVRLRKMIAWGGGGVE